MSAEACGEVVGHHACGAGSGRGGGLSAEGPTAEASLSISVLYKWFVAFKWLNHSNCHGCI